MVTPPVVTCFAVSNALPHAAHLGGNLTAGGTAEVWLYWGPADGQTDRANWARGRRVGNLAEGQFSTNVAGLAGGGAWFYRCYASNSAGEAWAPASVGFSTPAAWVLSVAHRGDSFYAPENTTSAFVSALGKAEMAEFDVQESRDGHLVVMHDSTVNRTTDGTGAVSNMTLAQLQALDAGSWFGAAFAGERIPTLAQALQTILPDMTPVIECKTGAASNYVHVLRNLGATTNVILTSMDRDFLKDIRRLQPDTPLGFIASGYSPTGYLPDFRSNGIRYVVWNGLSASEISAIHAAGLLAFAWTLNTAASVSNYIAFGADGIISDDPALVARLAQADSDGDGMADAWEVRRFGGAANADGGSDHDGDGAGDAAEFAAGTDPTNAASRLAIAACSSAGGSDLVLRWPSSGGRFYRIAGSASLAANLWTNVGDGLPPTPPLNVWTIRLEDAAGHFYRVGVHR